MWLSYPLKLWKKNRNVEWILLALLVLPEAKQYIAFTMSCSTVFSTHMVMILHTIFSHQPMTDVTMSSFIKILLILRSHNDWFGLLLSFYNTIAFFDHMIEKCFNIIVPTIKHWVAFLILADDDIGKTIDLVVLVLIALLSLNAAFKISVNAKGNPFIDHMIKKCFNIIVPAIKHWVAFLILADDDIGKTIDLVVLVLIPLLFLSAAFKISVNTKGNPLLFAILLNLMVVSSGNNSRCAICFLQTSRCFSKRSCLLQSCKQFMQKNEFPWCFVR